MRLRNKDEWIALLEERNQYKKTACLDADACDILRGEILASWKESRKLGVGFSDIPARIPLERETLRKATEESARMLEATKDLIAPFLEMAEDAEYSFYLSNREGIILLREGAIQQSFTGMYQTAKGMRFDTHIMGTNSHMLCMSQKKPVMLLGPEHYKDFWETFVAFSAPIFLREPNGKRILSGALTLLKEISPTPWLREVQDMYSDMLGLVTSIACGVENLCELRQSNRSLSILRNLLNTVLDSIEDPIITVNANGTLIGMNATSRELLMAEETSDPISDARALFNSNLCLLKALQNSEPVPLSDLQCIRIGENLFVARIVYMPQKTQNDPTAIISLTRKEKVIALLQTNLAPQTNVTFKTFVGKSPHIRAAMRKASNIATSSENILIMGESGVGKELVARCIHAESRPQKPFLSIDCNGLSEKFFQIDTFLTDEPIERNTKSEAFGQLELLQDGTLFLTNIGSLSLPAQNALLQIVKTRGHGTALGDQRRPLSFRLICCTKGNLLNDVKSGMFIEELYYRITVLQLYLPPLREHKEDIPEICEHIARRHCLRVGREKPTFSSEVMEVLKAYSWPGNERELRNVIIDSIDSGLDRIIEVGNLPQSFSNKTDAESLNALLSKNGAKRTLKDMEIAMIERALEDTNGKVSAAADQLGINRATLYRKMRDYSIDG